MLEDQVRRSSPKSRTQRRAIDNSARDLEGVEVSDETDRRRSLVKSSFGRVDLREIKVGGETTVSRNLLTS